MSQRGETFLADVNGTLEELHAPMKLVAVPGKGFGLLATRPLAAGSVVLCERPYAMTVSYRQRHQVCAVCLADSRLSEEAAPQGWHLRCSRCNVCYFCSEHCAERSLVTGGDAHSAQECAALAACAFHEADSEGADLTMQAIQILCHRAAGRAHAPFESARCEVSYKSYTERLHGIPRDSQSAARLKRSVATALRALPDEARVPPSELLDLLDRHQANVFGVLGPGAEEMGLASFVGLLHLFNHSCAPNLLFDCRNRAVSGASPLFAVVTLRAVAAGEELVHCYAGSADPRNTRQAWLRTHHGFECDCPRCSPETDMMDEMELTERLEEMRCRLPGCSTGLSYPFLTRAGNASLRCVQCGGEWNHEELSDSDYD